MSWVPRETERAVSSHHRIAVGVDENFVPQYAQRCAGHAMLYAASLNPKP